MPKLPKSKDKRDREIRKVTEDDERFKTTGEFFVGSKTVTSLTRSNFYDYIKHKDLALILFYEPSIIECFYAKKHMDKAAQSELAANKGYAAVNCATNALVCAKEEVTSLPFFKMFSRGKPVNVVIDHQNFRSREMEMYMKLRPISEDDVAEKVCMRTKKVRSI